MPPEPANPPNPYIEAADVMTTTPADPLHVQGLRRLLGLMVIAVASFAPIDVALYVDNGDIRSLYLAVLTGSMGAAFLYSRWLLRRGDLNTAILITSFSFLVPTFLLVFIQPSLFPVLAVGPLLAVGVTLPLARGRILAGLSITSWAFCIAIIVVGSVRAPVNPTDLPPVIQAVLFGAAEAIVLGLVLLVLWQFGGRLTAALNQSRESLAELQASHEQLKQLDHFKTQFMNIAAHEINTPLTPIRLQLHLLKQGQIGTLDSEATRALGIVDRNVERVTGLVHDVLEASRIQAGRLALHRTRIDLRDVVRDSYESFRDAARASGVTLEVRASEPLPAVADDRRLTQVLFNLVGNALKFTPRGGQIRIAAVRKGDHALVTVEDTGAGFSLEDKYRLFRPFSQIEDPDRTSRSGTGLGLFISKGIVEEHRGAIGAESRGRGRGSRFWFEVPLEAQETEEPSPLPTAEKPLPLSEPDMRIRDLI